MCLAQQLCSPLASSTEKAAPEQQPGSRLTSSKEPFPANYAPPSVHWAGGAVTAAVLGTGGNGAGAEQGQITTGHGHRQLQG